jgi:hypothetical protein
MNLNAAIQLQEPQHLSGRRMPNFFNRIAPLHFRIDNGDAVFMKRRKVSAGNVTVFIDCRGKHGSAVLAVPIGVIRAAAQKRNAKGCPGNDHCSASESFPVQGAALEFRTFNSLNPPSACFIATPPFPLRLSKRYAKPDNKSRH